MLVALNHHAYLPDLAMSVMNLAIRLAGMGRRAKALTAARQAAQLYRQAHQVHGDVYAEDVWRADSLVANLAESTD